MKASSFFLLLMAQTLFATDFPVADFGATGDGKSDDGPAIRKAVAAAVSAGAGSRIVFGKKTYRLDWCKTAPEQISIAGATNLVIEGNGAVLLNHPRNGLFSLNNCSGVSVRGFTVDFAPLPFTQGTITEVNAKEGWMDVRIQQGYRHPVDEYESLGLKPPKKDWGVVFDPLERHRRWDVPMHWMTSGFARSLAGADVVRVAFTAESKENLSVVRPGDRYVITFKYENSGANVALVDCGNCLFEVLTIHMAKYGMTFAVFNSKAQNVLRRVKMSDEAIGVLVGSSLPGMMGCREVNARVQRLLDPAV